MRIIYYTYPAFFDASLCMIRSLSKKVELYVILEVTPESRQGTILDLTSVPLVPGITPADPLLAPLLPEKIREYWKDVGGFYIATFNHPKSIQPETIRHGKIITDFMRAWRPDIILFDESDFSNSIQCNSAWCV